MRYNKEYYVFYLDLKEGEVARKVKGCDYKDTRMFIYKRDDGQYVLTDKRTGLRVVNVHQLKNLDDFFGRVQDAYEHTLQTDWYHKQVKKFANLILGAS